MSQSGNKIDQAMILAAGLGTRLRPLTYLIPKPLLKVGGVSLIDRNLKILKRAGIKRVVINLHHLGPMVKKHVGTGKRYGLKVVYTNETKILGTGGGIKNAERYLKGKPFIVINGDVFTKINLKQIIAYHSKSGGAATMVVRKVRKGEDYARINISKDGRLIGFGKGKFMFTGIQIFDPVIFKFLKKPSCLIESGYKKLLSNNLPVFTCLHKKYWNDIGTIERYISAQKKYG